MLHFKFILSQNAHFYKENYLLLKKLSFFDRTIVKRGTTHATTSAITDRPGTRARRARDCWASGLRLSRYFFLLNSEFLNLIKIKQQQAAAAAQQQQQQQQQAAAAAQQQQQPVQQQQAPPPQMAQVAQAAHEQQMVVPDYQYQSSAYQPVEATQWNGAAPPPPPQPTRGGQGARGDEYSYHQMKQSNMLDQSSVVMVSN